MARKPIAKADAGPVNITPIQKISMEIYLIGLTPLIYNSVSEKAKRELLYPRGRLNTAAKAENIKHDPISEYRGSIYRWHGNHTPTRLMCPATMIKGALMSAALRTPGIAKTELGQLVWVSGDLKLDANNFAVYGVPKLRMDVVRMADIGKTPDIRTRATLHRWCAKVVLSWVVPLITQQTVVNLLSASGMISGICDFRQEKGKGSFGQFEIFDGNNVEMLAEWNEIAKSGGRVAQDEALANPQCYDAQTEELLTWFQLEVKRRGRQDMIVSSRPVEEEEPFKSTVLPPPKTAKRNGARA